MNKHAFSFIAHIMVVLQLVGCAASPKRVIFDENNPTMESILHSKVSRSHTFPQSDANFVGGNRHHDINVFSQTTYRELNNPTLILYIEPHITKGGTYLPGMKVPYKQYDQVEFALPGER